jgi:hypothetical protein
MIAGQSYSIKNNVFGGAHGAKNKHFPTAGIDRWNPLEFFGFSNGSNNPLWDLVGKHHWTNVSKATPFIQREPPLSGYPIGKRLTMK